MVSATDSFQHTVALVDIALDCVNAALTVVGGAYHHTLSRKLRHQLHVVDDVAVVRAYHIAIRIEMGLCVHLRWRAKSRPPQLYNTPFTCHSSKVEPLGYCRYLAYIFTQINAAIFVNGGTPY
ncbi:MAG: hypothetical protein BWX88_00990 [Planctomycetes bacterium ADurb.Bin126]|nr:MAG: hypothetical protein BWX88_00990 [Planctomycetes bacterium ADurb.Bin126]